MQAKLEERLKNKNTKKVWEALRPRRGLSRQELIEATGLPRTTIYDALERLEMDGFVERRLYWKTGVRKPYTMWWLTADGTILRVEEINDILWRNNAAP